MTKLVFVRKEIESIDLYVSTDGTVTALSVSGLAKLCGISHRSMLDVCNLLNDAGGKSVPKQLEGLQSKVYLDGGYDVEGSGVAKYARLINSKSAARIIRYYAYESKAANDTAKISYDKFAERGIDIWIKDVTEFQKEHRTVELSLDAIKELHRIVGEHIRDAEIIREEIPGVGVLISAYKNSDDEPEIVLGSAFTLADWLLTKGCVNKSAKCRFAHYLSGYYRGTTLEQPVKVKYLANGRYIGNSNTYTTDKIPLLESAWNAFSSC